MSRFLTQWAKFVVRYPAIILLVMFSIAATGGYLASNIGIKSNFAALLPENEQSVKDLESISKRMGGMGTLIIQLESDNLKAMQRFADDLVAKMNAYPNEEVKYINYKINEQKKFFDKNKFLYLSLYELEDLRDGINERLRKEKLKANPLWIDLDDDDEKEEGFDFKEKKKEYEKESARFDKYKDGYLTNEAGDTLIIVVKTPGNSTGVKFAQRFVKKVQNEINALDPKRYDESLQAFLTGDLKTLTEEYYALRDDIIFVSNLLVVVVIFAVMLYYRSIRMTIILCVGLVGGILTTFGIVYLHIGYLTAATAFLAAIVAGNGINFGIYFLARYMEERAKGGELADILGRSMIGTVKSISMAAMAAGASYLSLMFTDFRGFNQFGFIGGVGMIVCLIFALSATPALTVLIERFLPFKNIEKLTSQKGRIFSNGAAWLVERFAKPIFAFGIVLVIGSVIFLAFFLRDPFEYEYRKLRNQFTEKEGSGKKSGQAEKILGKRSSPHIILADNIEQVPLIKDALMPYVNGNTEDPDGHYFKEVKTVYDHLPGSEKIQKRKLRVLNQIRKTIEKNDFDFLDKEDKKLLDDLTPPKDLKVLTVDDLPKKIIWPYVELNGTVGTLVLVYMRDGWSVWDGRDLQKFAAKVREVKLANNETVRSSGHAVIFSDMLHYVAHEGPWASLGAFLFVTLVIFIFTRSLRHGLTLAFSMAAGVVLMMGVAIVTGQKINFLNYIAIPIQFGIGVDYSVNLYNRFLEEGEGSLGHVLRTTGGAVMITSLTTVIGYGALWFSLNGAINSFGTLANIGEVTCLFTAVILLPAYLAIFRKGVVKK